MRIKHRYGYNSSETQITKFLDIQGIKYDQTGGIITFEIYNDHENCNYIIKFMEAHSVSENLSEAQYTKDEINAAQWLSVRSTWRNGYPQPQDDMGYRFSTYDSTNYCEKCRFGLIQKENFMLKKEPNWGTRDFLMINWIQDELFISKNAEKFFRTGDLTGFDIYDVFTKSRSIMEGIKQLYVRNYLDFGLMPETIKEKFHCSKCNHTIYIAKPVIYYDRKVFKSINLDIIKTQEKFGQLTCSSIIFVTHKFFKAIIEAKLDRGLVFEPVQLV